MATEAQSGTATPRARHRRRRTGRGRRVLVVLAVLVLVPLLVFGAAAAYFAGQIHSDGLAVQQPGAQKYDLVVDAYTEGQVTLRRTGHTDVRDPLTVPDRYGLVWPNGGAGILTGAPADRPGGGHARSLLVTGGTPPTPGTPAALNRDVWADPRAAYGLSAQDVAYPCAGGSCPAWFLPGRGSTWLVLVHGKGATRTEPLRALGAGLAAGLPALDITYRNDVGAPADPSSQYRYGDTEWRDLEQAVGYATGHGATDVVLFGASMGGAIVASFLEHSSSARLVRGVVLDSPALDFRATVDHGAAHRKLPLLGTPIPVALTRTAEWIAGLRYGVDWNRVDYLPGDWLTVPALVFHGTADATVPVATSDRLKAAHPGLVQEVRVEGATHVESWNVDPAAYTARESAFLTCVTAPTRATSCPG